MICTDCEDALSDYIDGSLELGDQVKIERHIAECPSCRSTRDDLLQIIHFSRRLPPQTPSNSVWARVEAATMGEKRSSFSRSARALWSAAQRRSIIPLELAALVAIISIIGTTVVLRAGHVVTGQPLPTEPRVAAPALARNDLDPAVKDMQQRIEYLREAVDRRSAAWNPGVRSAFNRDMSYVDQTLMQCSQDLDSDPNNEVTHELMLNAYKEKVRLLEGFNDF